MSADRSSEQYRQLIGDPEVRAALVADPKAALVAYFGAIVEGDYRIEVIEQRSDTITAVVPVPPAPGADVEARRAQVSGRIFDLLHSTGVGGYLIPDSGLTWVLRDMRSLWAQGLPRATWTRKHGRPATAALGDRPETPADPSPHRS
jgi:hypothetical protein